MIDIHLTLDHMITLTRDLDAARDTYARLGFTLTDRSRHKHGVENYTVPLHGNYLELLGAWDRNSETEAFFETLAEYEGPTDFLIRDDDSAAIYAHLCKHGLDTRETEHYQRGIEIDGKTEFARFDINRPKVTRFGRTSVFFCHHFTPEFVWRPDYMTHANGARAIRSFTVVGSGAADRIEEFTTLFGPGRVIGIEGGLRLDLQDRSVRIVSPEVALAVDFADVAELAIPGEGLRKAVLEVAHLPDTLAYFDGKGIPIVETSGGHIFTPASEGLGLVFEWRASDAA